MVVDATEAGYPAAISEPPPVSEIKRTRSSKKQTETEQIENLAALIEGLHRGAAGFIGPEFACTRDEGRRIARPAVTLARLYNVDLAKYERTMAWGALLGAVMDVEVPRIKVLLAAPRKTSRREEGGSVSGVIDIPRPAIVIPG